MFSLSKLFMSGGGSKSVKRRSTKSKRSRKVKRGGGSCGAHPEKRGGGISVGRPEKRGGGKIFLGKNSYLLASPSLQ